jgi:hypothetical protein
MQKQSSISYFLVAHNPVQLWQAHKQAVHSHTQTRSSSYQKDTSAVK